MVIVCLRKVTRTPSHRCLKNIAVSSGECEISDAPHSDSLDTQWAMPVGDKVILDSSKHAYIDSVHAWIMTFICGANCRQKDVKVVYAAAWRPASSQDSLYCTQKAFCVTRFVWDRYVHLQES